MAHWEYVSVVISEWGYLAQHGRNTNPSKNSSIYTDVGWKWWKKMLKSRRSRGSNPNFVVRRQRPYTLRQQRRLFMVLWNRAIIINNNVSLNQSSPNKYFAQLTSPQSSLVKLRSLRKTKTWSSKWIKAMELHACDLQALKVNYHKKP